MDLNKLSSNYRLKISTHIDFCAEDNYNIWNLPHLARMGGSMSLELLMFFRKNLYKWSKG